MDKGPFNKLLLSLLLLATSLTIKHRWLLVQTCRQSHVLVSLSVGLSRVLWRIPFGVVSGVGRGIGELDACGDRRR